MKFITAAREMLTSYTDHDNLYNEDFSSNFFFNKYFREIIVNNDAAEHSIWHRYLADVIFVVQNAKASSHNFSDVVFIKEIIMSASNSCNAFNFCSSIFSNNSAVFL